MAFDATAIGEAPDQIDDFDIAEDVFQLNAGDFGVTGDLSFVNALAADLPAGGANVIVLQDSDDDGDAGTVFNARSAARLIGEQVTEDGAGFFVYFNSALGVNRLVFSENLADGEAAFTVLAALNDLVGDDAINALPTFTSSNFRFENIQTAGDDTVFVNAVDGGTLQGGDGVDTLDVSRILVNEGEQVLVDLDINNQGNFTPGAPSTQDGEVRVFDADGNLVRTLAVVDFENIIGSDASETLFGNNETNVIEGNGGDDRIHPFGGVDTVDGGEGSDTLLLNAAGGSVVIDLANQIAGPNTLISVENADGGAFNDTLIGSDEANILNGNGGNDVIDGQGGNDTFNVGAEDGRDTIRGGSGNDTLFVNGNDGAGERLRVEARGNEFLVRNNFGDRAQTTFSQVETLFVNGQGGDDDLRVDGSFNQGVDIILDGGAGNDTLRANNGAVTLLGGEGDDLVTGGNRDDVADGGAGNDTVRGGNGRDTLEGGAGDDSIDGGNDNDSLSGGEGNDNLQGRNGFDTIDGGDGNDFVNGGNDFDDLSGGAGNDTLIGGNGFDTLDGGEGDDDLNGGNDFDVLSGGAGNDTLTGGNGFDTLNGGEGVDVLNGGSDRDTFVFDGDPFNGVDVSAEGRSVVNTPDEIVDFTIREDRFGINATDFEIDSFAFVSGVAAEINRDGTVIVLENGFANAGAAAAAIAENDAITADEGLFVYFNTNLGINRLVYSNDLSDNGDISILANLTGQTGDEALEALEDFSAANFAFL